jgi:hypothetical protein
LKLATYADEKKLLENRLHLPSKKAKLRINNSCALKTKNRSDIVFFGLSVCCLLNCRTSSLSKATSSPFV